MEQSKMDMEVPLVRLSNELNQIFQHAAVVLILIDKEGRVANINRTGTELVGKDPESVIGYLGGQVFNCISAWVDGRVVCGNSDDCMQCAIRTRVSETFRTGNSFYKEEGAMNVFLEGNPTELTLLISTAKIEANNEEYVLLTLDDITKRKLQEEELKELIAIKDKFFSIIAHDLKNPFNMLLGFTELLMNKIENYTPESVLEIAQMMNRNAQRTYELLENLLTWSKSQRNKINFNPKVLKLHSLTDSVLENFRDYALQKGIQVENLIDKDQRISADEPMLRTILRNLVHNGIKFTNEGDRVTVTAQRKRTGIEVSVSDTGVGMSEKQLNNVFRIDKPQSTTGTNKEKGSGLGLILCNEFIERHCGRIWVESEKGKGTSFTFYISDEILLKQ